MFGLNYVQRTSIAAKLPKLNAANTHVYGIRSYGIHLHMNLPSTHLLYLHGFRSSPLSAKSRMMAEVVKAQHPQVLWWAPQLPPSPQLAMQSILEGVEQWPRTSMAVVGSSLGGFYATYLGQKMGCKTVVLNPAIAPARDLEKHIGEHRFWHKPEESFYFEPKYVQELRDMPVGPLQNPHQTMAVIAKGDEVLDWQEMYGAYKQCSVRLIEGSDHGLSDFAEHLPAIMDFLNLA